MIESDLMLLPPELAAYSIDDREIVLPLSQAVAAVDHLERCGRHVVGWEGWLLYPAGEANFHDSLPPQELPPGMTPR
jgi:hypothetical protein